MGQGWSTPLEATKAVLEDFPWDKTFEGELQIPELLEPVETKELRGLPGPMWASEVKGLTFLTKEKVKVQIIVGRWLRPFKGKWEPIEVLVFNRGSSPQHFKKEESRWISKGRYPVDSR